jgi:hypothetical protein
MPTEKKSKSSKLKKYEGVYKKLLREQQKSTKSIEKSIKRSPKKESKRSPKKESKRSPKKESKRSPKKEVKTDPKKEEIYVKKLNSYQLFVQNESKKSKYKGLEPRERMSLISKEWKKNN